MESKEIECNSGVKKYNLEDKIAIMTKMGIDFLNNGKTIEEQHRDTKSLILEIINDEVLLKILDGTKDEFWDEAKNGLLMYEDFIYMTEEKNLSARTQCCNNEKFMTLGGEEIVVEEPKDLPVLVKQKRRRADGDRYFGCGI